MLTKNKKFLPASVGGNFPTRTSGIASLYYCRLITLTERSDKPLLQKRGLGDRGCPTSSVATASFCLKLYNKRDFKFAVKRGQRLLADPAER